MHARAGRGGHRLYRDARPDDRRDDEVRAAPAQTERCDQPEAHTKAAVSTQALVPVQPAVPAIIEGKTDDGGA